MVDMHCEEELQCVLNSLEIHVHGLRNHVVHELCENCSDIVLEWESFTYFHAKTNFADILKSYIVKNNETPWFL